MHQADGVFYSSLGVCNECGPTWSRSLTLEELDPWYLSKIRSTLFSAVMKVHSAEDHQIIHCLRDCEDNGLDLLGFRDPRMVCQEPQTVDLPRNRAESSSLVNGLPGVDLLHA